MDLNNMTQSIIPFITQFGFRILGAIAFWLVGGWLIKLVIKITQRALSTNKVDPTVIIYIASAMRITLKILLVVGILGFLGIETTTFAALLAALGLAIGVAWSGLLANLAAGAFLVLFRPFETGDEITAGGVTGKVEEVGLFSTVINTTADNVRTFVGNNKIFSDNIQNLTANSYRLVECSAQLDHTTDHNAAIDLLRERISKIPNVLPHPEIEIGIKGFTAMGPVLAVKPACHGKHHDQILYDTNRVIRETFGDAGFQVPKQHFAVKQ